MSSIDARFDGRIAIKARVLAPYRAPLYDMLSRACTGGVHVAAGQPRVGESLGTTDRLDHASFRKLANRYLLSGALVSYWQAGASRWLREVDPDVLIMEANPRCIDSRMLRAQAAKRGIPVIGWGLGTMSLADGFDGLRAWLRRSFVRQFDGMITYSSRAADEYVAAGVPRECVVVAHNAVSRRPTWPLPNRDRSIDVSAGRVLFVGRLIEWKRVDQLIHACARSFGAAGPQLTIVGDGPMRASYEALAAQIYPRTVFKGELRGESLAAEFRRADLFVLPNKGGLAIQEAMAYGLPVIASDADGTELDLVRPRNGWLLPRGEVEDLSGALTDAFVDIARLRAMGAESYRIVSEEINLEALCSSILGAVGAIVARRRHRSPARAAA